jgi:ribosomal-protein-alanine N-acetyltransferase
VDDVAVLEFAIRPMTAADAHAIATWRYPGEYSFYDADADPDDLAELLDPAEWGQRYFAADELAGHTLAGSLMVKLTGPVAEIGLGLRPDLTGRGMGLSFVEAGLAFAREHYAPAAFRLYVLSWNERAMRVYERAGFARVRTFTRRNIHGESEFVEMTRPA